MAQEPFIEATPAFPPARKLAELEQSYPTFLPRGLAELVQHGVPVDRFPLYTHQEEALVAAYSKQPNLLVATGTGSGKTESFLLPILSDLLNEAHGWGWVRGKAHRGQFDDASRTWVHARTHETRPAALRAIVLYPMNALVNDQLSRLRRILARGASPDWQRRNLQGNVIHFGMYTSLTQPTADYKDSNRRHRFAAYLRQIEEDWQRLSEELRDTGSWPRPDSPEMLCRWDMQAAPPDILVTNYSMLEYMLVRPIESAMFDRTRKWLEADPNARITLVLDEAHTYTGAKGTEVAHLVRRLKERLGIETASGKFRAIATTASVPQGGDNQLLQFTSDLFGEPSNSFSLIRAGAGIQTVPERRATERSLHAFSTFHSEFSADNPWPAIQKLAYDLGADSVNATLDPQIAMHDLLEHSEDVLWVRQRTARRATLLSALAEECWPNLELSDEKEGVTAGILAAGSFARPSSAPDTPPLLSMRVHAFFRGVPGIWACMDPKCGAVPDALRTAPTPRPVGKLYMDPRLWCECGARVLELFSCRQCGLLYLGGIPDNQQGSLWPWGDDLTGDKQDLQSFRIFGVEAPFAGAEVSYRSTRSTLETHPQDVFVRATYEVESAIDRDTGHQVSPFPNQCPRCQKYRQPGSGGREVIEPLRTKGPQTFAVIAEDGFRVQQRSAGGTPPNYGRKALLFTDSRPEAAQLAADIRFHHHADLFRQLLYRALHTCGVCRGHGVVS